MGGNALSYTTVRLTDRNFHRFAADTVSKLRSLLPGRKISAIEAYRSKSDFGDLDVLVESSDYDPFKAAEALGAIEIVRNGPVTSIGVVVRPELGLLHGNVFQVDLIAIDEPSFDYAKGYFAFNDLGNLVGRIAHAMGVSHRHDGLYFYVRDGDYKFREICLTKDHALALAFLGFSLERFAQGFETLEEIFRFVGNSPFFNSDIFLLENRNAVSRVRDRKRKTYTAFLSWCELHHELPQFPFPEDKAAWQPRIEEYFPHFNHEHAAALQDLSNQRLAKEKFNGALVASLTGLEGKALGELMKRIKTSFGGPEALRSEVLGITEEALRQRILDTHTAMLNDRP
ncbi:ABC transporter permease [Novimethylophilus kurashikiensis]|uniref:ABC transporter permease n=1 Tax=Novimethylophilus kurashikiensis TaxID=1825523 RepID=A0A2R5FD22_9PROT|nr:hypothetical protein [Novimethylophilus kurashikiensis]GBG14813.1 ABC transporter permease [Novimethylophilus kurashikiensis]